MRRLSSHLATGFLVPAGLFLPIAASLGADISWDNPGTGAFTNGANWTPANVPGSGDNAIIGNGGTAELTTGESATVGQLRVNNGALTQDNATITTGITSSGWQTTGDLQIGGSSGQTGSMTVSGNSTITAGRVRIGGYNTGSDASNVHGNLTMSGSSSLAIDTNGFDFWLGNGTGSTASLNMSGSSVIDIKQSGGTAARAGAVTNVVQSGTSQFKARDTYWIGEGGTATWHVQESANLQTTNGALVLGQGGGASATLNVSGGTVSTGDHLRVGHQGGDGEVNLSGGTVTVGNEFQVGNEGGEGTVNVSGGQLTVANWSSIGRQGSGSGTVTVSGTGVFNHTATRDANSHLIVGDGATGTLNVQGGSVTSSKTIWIGGGATGVGTVNITGGNLTATGANIIVGLDAGGQGVLNLTGGTVTANAIVEQDGSGTINFDGGILRAGAASGDFLAGFEDGDLNILDGGLIFDTDGHAVTILQGLAGIGGVTKLGVGNLTFSSINMAYLGDTAISGGTLSIGSAFLSDTSNVLISSASVFDLNFTGTDTINQLFINGVAQSAGTWGSIGSGAQFESALFTGDGLLLVSVPEPEHYALGVAAMLGLAVLARRRQRA